MKYKILYILTLRVLDENWGLDQKHGLDQTVDHTKLWTGRCDSRHLQRRCYCHGWTGKYDGEEITRFLRHMHSDGCRLYRMHNNGV